MAPPPQRRRIEIDALFVPMPQALIADEAVSAAACRLWGMIFTFGWNGTPPELEALAAALGANWRSVYRWAQELHDAGWIDWDRNKAIGERFTLRTSPHGDTIVTPDKTRRGKLSPLTKELSPRSKELIVVTKELSQVTISGLGDPALMRQTDPDPYHDSHDKDQNHVGVDVGRTLAFLVDEGVSAAEEFAHLPYESMRADYAARRTDGQTKAQIVKAWRLNPPTETYHYERPNGRPVQSESPKNQTSRPSTGQHGPTGGSDIRDPGWRDRLLDAAERGEL
jgi:hypothetical protein